MRDSTARIYLGETHAVLYTPYNHQWMGWFKSTIPENARRWDAVQKRWLIDADQAGTVLPMLRKTFGEVDNSCLQNENTATERSLDLLYVGRVDSKGRGFAFARAVLASAPNDWVILLTEDALRSHFDPGWVLRGKPKAQTTSAIPNDWYQVLAVTPTATDDEIKSAWRRGLMTWHPDKCNEPDARQWFDAIQAAYTTLKDPGARQMYDTGRYLESITATKTSRFAAGLYAVPASYTPPIRGGLLDVIGVPGAYFTVTQITGWHDVTNSQGQIRISHWDAVTQAIKTEYV